MTMIDPISARVVTAVAAEKGVDRTCLPPLIEAVDPDALDALFAADRNGNHPNRRGEVRFRYAGREVRVRDGVVTVGEGRPADDG